MNSHYTSIGYMFMKHYFIGDKQIASKLGTGRFNNVYGISGNNITAGAFIPHRIC